MKVSGLTFGYGRKQIFSDLDWEFADHEKIILLGPNGAGKTTLLKLLAGYLRADAGELSRADGSALRRGDVGWMPQDIRPIPGLRVREQIAYAAWCSGLTTREARKVAEPCMAKVGVTELADSSGGSVSPRP